jgi:hypothetical protein
LQRLKVGPALIKRWNFSRAMFLPQHLPFLLAGLWARNKKLESPAARSSSRLPVSRCGSYTTTIDYPRSRRLCAWLDPATRAGAAKALLAQNLDVDCSSTVFGVPLTPARTGGATARRP